MANVKPKADLVTSITADLADNNAGLISAEDVRSNMADIATSINDIVASGDTQTAYPFHNNVTVKKSTTDGATGRVYVGSGIFFPNSTDASTEQTLPYPGPANISHNDLGNLTAGDPHTQYLPTDGSRTMAGNLGTNTYFINSSGTSNGASNTKQGIGFQRDEKGNEEILVSGTVVFEDKSKINTALSTARAWATFDASPGIVSWSGYNVTAISKSASKFSITFDSGVLNDNNYLAFGYSNGRSTAEDNTDFDRCFVGMTARAGEGTAASQHTLSFAVLTESGVYSSWNRQNHVVIFGMGSGVVTNNINTGSIS